MEGIPDPASVRLAALRRAHPEADIHPVGGKLVAWIADKADPFSGEAVVGRTEAELDAKLAS